MDRKLLKRNIVALALSVLILIIPLLFEFEAALAKTGNAKNGYVQEIEYHLTDKIYEKVRNGEAVHLESYYKEHIVRKYETLSEGSTFAFKFPQGRMAGQDKRYFTEKVLLNGTIYNDNNSISYRVTNDNKIVVYAYSDYLEKWTSYVTREPYPSGGYNQKVLKTDIFYAKDKPGTVYHVDFNRIPGYKVSYLEFAKRKMEPQEYVYLGVSGYKILYVIMEPIEVKDEEPPEIFVKDIYAPLFALRNGVIDTSYIINEISAKDNKDGTLNRANSIGGVGIYIENYKDADLKTIVADTVAEIIVAAKDTAGNISRKTLKLYAVDTTPVNTTKGRVKRVRFFD